MAEISKAARDAANEAVRQAIKPDARMDREVYEADLVDAALTTAAPHIEAAVLRKAAHEDAIEVVEAMVAIPYRFKAVPVERLMERSWEIEGGSDG